MPEYGKNETEKQIEIKKVNNFRTLGNIRNSDGRTIREGIFYRSGHLHQLTRRSFKKLTHLGVREIIDLRNSKEISRKPDRLPEQVAYKNYSAFDDEGDQLEQAKNLC